MKIFSSKNLIIILALGLAVRVTFLVVGLSAGGHDFYLNYGDAKGYTYLANNLLEGNGFSMSQLSPYALDSTRTPAYPFFLAASLFISGGFWLVIALQIILGALIPILAYFLLKKLNFSDGISLASAVFFAIEPFFASHSVFLLSEVLFIFLFLLACIFYFKFWEEKIFWPLIVSAIFLGIAALTRPIGFYMIFIFVFHIIFVSFRQWREALKRALIYIVVSLAVISPWLYRNYQQFGVLKLSSIDSIGLYLYQAGSVLAMENGTEFEIEKRKLWDELEKEGINYKSLSDAGILNKKAIAIIASHPKAFLKVNTLVAWQFFTHDAYYDLAWHLGFYRDAAGPPITILDLKGSLLKLPKVLMEDPMFFLFIAGRALWVMIFLSALCGIFISLRNGANLKRDIFMILMIAYVLLASLGIGYSINARFRIPILPFYIGYTALGFLFITEKCRRAKY